MFCVLTNTYVVECKVTDCELKEECDKYNDAERFLTKIIKL